MDAVANMVQQGQAAASGATQITVEKHKINFLAQYGTFEDKPSQNIVRWLRKADKYKNSHMIPSLEMGSIIIHCIRGEPAIKVKRMLDVPGLNYINADHYCAQPEQAAQEYLPYQERVEAVQHVPGVPFQAAIPEQPQIEEDLEAIPPQPFVPFQPAVPQVDEVLEVPFQPLIPARPAVLPRRAEPLVLPNQCLRHYLTLLYQKLVNLSDADKFLSTFKKQKPKQTCSNFLDEFIIQYENYAHMKWSIEELDGIEAVAPVQANPNANPPVLEVIEVIGAEGNQVLRNAEMIQLATDGLCEEFKIHCDFTNVNLRNITFPELEVAVQQWQRNTTTGKTFTAACNPANDGKKHANVSALELSDYFDMNKSNLPQEEADTSAATTSIRGQRGGGRGRGFGRGMRGRGGRNSRQPFKPSIQSKDIQDGGYNNYKQTPDGKVILSPQGHPLCNYCGTPSHKREICGIKKADRAAGLNRTVHPDRDIPRPPKIPKQPKTNTTDAVTSAATPIAQIQQYAPPYPVVPWNYQVAMQQHPPAHNTRMEQDQIIPNTVPYGIQNGQQTPKIASANVIEATPCPYSNCQAMLTDQHITQEHFRTFHGQNNNLTPMSGNPL